MFKYCAALHFTQPRNRKFQFDGSVAACAHTQSRILPSRLQRVAANGKVASAPSPWKVYRRFFYSSDLRSLERVWSTVIMPDSDRPAGLSRLPVANISVEASRSPGCAN